jgi:hypothetical protein
LDLILLHSTTCLNTLNGYHIKKYNIQSPEKITFKIVDKHGFKLPWPMASRKAYYITTKQSWKRFLAILSGFAPDKPHSLRLLLDV